MMAIKLALRSVGAIAVMGLVSSPAFAGNFAPGYPATSVSGSSACSGVGNCNSGVDFMSAPQGHSGPMTVQSRTPYDFLDRVHFQRSPHISITRVHGMTSNVGLSDAPSGFTGGCQPHSTTYCRTGQSSVVKPPIAPSPSVPRPHVSRPYVSNPVAHRPVVQHPQPAPRVVAVGGGYDPSKFTPRVYGDPYTITPGIAYLPTSIVVRDPRLAQAVLDTGQARPNPWTPGGITPAYLGVPVQPHVPNVRPPYYHPRPPVIGGPVYSRPPVIPTRPSQPVVCTQPRPTPPYMPAPRPLPTPCGITMGQKSRY